MYEFNKETRIKKILSQIGNSIVNKEFTWEEFNAALNDDLLPEINAETDENVKIKQ